MKIAKYFQCRCDIALGVTWLKSNPIPVPVKAQTSGDVSLNSSIPILSPGTYLLRHEIEAQWGRSRKYIATAMNCILFNVSKCWVAYPLWAYPRENATENKNIHTMVKPWPTLFVLSAKNLKNTMIKVMSTACADADIMRGTRLPTLSI